MQVVVVRVDTLLTLLLVEPQAAQVEVDLHMDLQVHMVKAVALVDVNHPLQVV